MPRSGKKGSKKNPYTNCTDVKLSDFADSDVSAVRRKPVLNSLTREVKQLCALEKAWIEEGKFETDNCDFGIDGEDSTTESPSPVRKKNSKSKSKEVLVKKEDSGVTYPLDVWFLLSDYIRPEEVKTFASICKSSYFVARTYSFWISLYKRYYKSGTQLPLRLQSCCIERPHTLKVCVVRALYHFYPRFINTISSSRSCEVSQLLKFVCVSMWHVQANNKWCFCFKFKSKSSVCKSNSTVIENTSKQKDVGSWEAADYVDPKKLQQEVNGNSEDGCKVLKITSPHFIASPLVMGAHLADIKLGLARDMIKQKLQMVFSFSNYKQTCKNIPSVVSRNCGGTGEVLEFEPVENVVVLDWWHPQYPSGNVFL